MGRLSAVSRLRVVSPTSSGMNQARRMRSAEPSLADVAPVSGEMSSKAVADLAASQDQTLMVRSRALKQLASQKCSDQPIKLFLSEWRPSSAHVVVFNYDTRAASGSA